jgi:uracil-DNA glycosylase
VATKRKAGGGAAQADFGFASPGGPETPPPRLTAWAPAAWPADPSWAPVLQAFWASPAGRQLGDFMAQRLAKGAVIYPSQPLRALDLTPLPAVRVLILGQDPYHGPNQAHGLAFSVQHGQRVPPSLRNIFNEIERADLPGAPVSAQPRSPRSASLEAWARQGVLLLNTCLTVEAGAPASHAKKGWEALTDSLILAVAQSAEPAVFMLWGAHAQAKQALIKPGRHLVLTANHPSPLSARRPPLPFWGCGHFASANAWLLGRGREAIRW